MRSPLEELQASSDTNVFVMMRYRDTQEFATIEQTIKDALRRFGLHARLAKDAALSDNLWENIRLYMTLSRYGVAVFEQMEEREFNPNIALELGYMFALERRCLLLKDRLMPSLPTDVVGMIYRNFDPYKLADTISNEITAWCEKDLRLPRVDSARRAPAAESDRYRLVYDSIGDDQFVGWGMYDTTFNFAKHIRLVEDESQTEHLGKARALELRADGTESVGVHRKVETLHGLYLADYFAISSAVDDSLNLYLCVIPMQGSLDELLEVGAKFVDDPVNALSPYRVKQYVPRKHIGKGIWYTARLEFDFRETAPDATYAICAVRINEGCPIRGAGALRIRNVQVRV